MKRLNDGIEKAAADDWLMGGGGMGKLIRSIDWSATPLGSRTGWPDPLRAIVNVALSHPFAMAILWGNDLILIYNDAYRVIAANKHPRAMGRSTREIWPEVWEFNRPIFEKVMRDGQSVHMENQLFRIKRRNQMEDAYFTLSYSPVWLDQSRVGGTLVTLIEITDRRRAEEALQDSEKLFRTTFMSSPVALSLIRLEGRVCIDINQAEVDIFGYTRDEVIGKSRASASLWEDADERQTFLADLLKNGKAKMEGVRLRHKDGKRIIASVSANLMSLKGVSHVLYASEDITERKQAEEALLDREKLFRAAFLESPVALSFCQPEKGICLDINQAEADMFGYSREEVIGTNRLADVWDDTADRERFIEELLINGKVRNECVRLRHKNGRLVLASVSASLLILKGVKHSLLASADITERKQSENLIKQSLLEKEVLLKEIHHRVKNNLAVISSLIGLQANRIEESAVKEMLAICQNRIRSMALVHEKLYQSENLSAINFNDYIRSIIDELTAAYQPRMKPVRVHASTQEILLNIDKAIPCALIVNEMVANAFKHAFVGIEEPRLMVAFEKDDRCFTLTVKDNGNGMADALGAVSGKTLGLMLVHSLTRQLRGNLRFVTDPAVGRGITVILNFEE